MFGRSRAGLRSTFGAVAAACALAATATVGAGTAHAQDPTSAPVPATTDARPRTVVTTDMEQDDLASLVHYMFYLNDVDTQGLIYASSKWHWAGDGTPGSANRWTGTRTIQDQVIAAYAKVYPNLKRHDPSYPTPSSVLSKVAIGNIDFEDEMSYDTAGSNLIKSLLLDSDPRPLYIQVWGGFSTTARALRSIEIQYAGTPQWASIKAKVTKKAVILASGFQDHTYDTYISKAWPLLRVEGLAAGYATWGYNCNNGQGNVRGLPGDRAYFHGGFIKSSIQIGPLGSLYRSWLDGQKMSGDPADIFGDPTTAPNGWCKPLGKYDFLSEGDNVAYLPLLHTGIENPGNPLLGGWGGRATQVTSSPNLWNSATTEVKPDGTAVANYTTSRWEAAVWNDFANRVQWSLTPRYTDSNHAPSVSTSTRSSLYVTPGQTIQLRGQASDPDGNAVDGTWWQYREEGTYDGAAKLLTRQGWTTAVTVPADAQPGQTISIILQGTDVPGSGQFPLTRYARTTLTVV